MSHKNGYYLSISKGGLFEKVEYFLKKIQIEG